MALYQWFARKYSWTPAQVDSLDLEQMTWLPIMEEALGDAIEHYRAEAED